jgi:putative exosortase-associated protein (TIGR04073 family)
MGARRNNMRVKKFYSVFFMLCALGGPLASTAFAGTYRTIENSSPQEITSGMSAKAGRGIVNTATGWLEFPKQIYVTWTEEGPATGICVGPFKGLGMTIVRTVTGVAELVTFYVASPGFYDPYFEPAFIWQGE